MFGFSTVEVAIIALIILLLFGGRKLPELFKGIGESIKELRKGIKGDK